MQATRGDQDAPSGSVWLRGRDAASTVRDSRLSTPGSHYPVLHHRLVTQPAGRSRPAVPQSGGRLGREGVDMQGDAQIAAQGLEVRPRGSIHGGR